jgi:single-strand DNA-binding protein
MPNKNLVILVGHLGGDPEVRYAQSGTCVCNFSLATSWGKKDSDGNWENFTDWHKVVCFAAIAEKVAEKAQKGHAVMVEGTIRYESWTDDQGVKKYMTKIIGNRVDILAAGFTEKPAADADPVKDTPADAAKQSAENRTKAAQAATEEEEDDLPF